METTENSVSQTPSETKRSSLLRLPEPSALPRWWAPALLILALAWAALLQTRGSSMPGIAVAIVETGYLWLVLAYYRWKSVDWFGWTLAFCAFAAAAWFGIWRSDDIGTYLTLVLGWLNLILPAYVSGVIRETWDTLYGIGVKLRIAGAFFLTVGPASALWVRSFSLVGRSWTTARYGVSVLVLGAILLLLVPLLSTSDAAFAHLVARVVPDWLHNISFGRILEVAIWTIFYIIVVWAYVLTPSRVAVSDARERPINPVSLSWPLILGGVVALYAVYIGVQVRYFFLAADANVYQAFGLTYAEYIHKGFYELLTVSGLNILIAKVSWELSREREDRPSMLVRALIGLVLACAVVIACSGISRTWHYITAYGLSVERLLVVYASVLAIAVFLVGFAKLASPRLREMPLAVAVALVSFVALAYTNIEETVASYNIATQPIEKLDSLYILESLSEDALDEKLWILARDPERVVRTDIDWACDVDIRAAQRDGTPPPVCDPQKEVTNREALRVWLSQARNRANRSNMLRPPLWIHANYSAWRLYGDDISTRIYGDKLKWENPQPGQESPDPAR